MFLVPLPQTQYAEEEGAFFVHDKSANGTELQSRNEAGRYISRGLRRGDRVQLHGAPVWRPGGCVRLPALIVIHAHAFGLHPCPPVPFTW